MTYPNTLGYKEAGVSRKNAGNTLLKRKLGTLREEVHQLFLHGFIGTADEAAERLGYSILSVRPRCTELVRMGKIKKFRQVKSGPLDKLTWQLKLVEPDL